MKKIFLPIIFLALPAFAEQVIISPYPETDISIKRRTAGGVVQPISTWKGDGSGFSLFTAGSTQVLASDSSSQLYLGKTTSNDTTMSRFYGSIHFGLGAAVPINWATGRLIGDKASSVVLYNSTSDMRLQLRSGAYVTGSGNFHSYLNTSGSNIQLFSGSSTASALFTIMTSNSYSHAADSAAAYVINWNISHGGDVVQGEGFTVNGTRYYDLRNTSTVSDSNDAYFNILTADKAGTGTAYARIQKTKGGTLNITNSESDTGFAQTQINVAGRTMMQIGSANITFAPTTGSYTRTFRFNGGDTAGGHALVTAQVNGAVAEVAAVTVGETGNNNLGIAYDRNGGDTAFWTRDTVTDFIYTSANTISSPMTGMTGYLKVGSFTSAGAWTFPISTTHTFGNTTDAGNTYLLVTSKGTDRPYLRLRTGTTDYFDLSIGSSIDFGRYSAKDYNFKDESGNIDFVIKANGQVNIGPGSGLTSNHSMVNSATNATDTVLNIVKNGVGGSNSRLVAGLDNTTTRGYIRINSGLTSLEFESTSDRRIKSNIVDAENCLEKVLAIPLRRFSANGVDNQIGWVAQEVFNYIPEAVTTTDDGQGYTLPENQAPWTISETIILKHLWGATQELSAQNRCLANADTKEQRLACF